MAGTLAVAALGLAGVVGVTRGTAPGELACDSVGVSGNETAGTFGTPTEAAADYADGLLGLNRDAVAASGGVVDVTGSARLGDESLTGTVFRHPGSRPNDRVLPDRS